MSSAITKDDILAMEERLSSRTEKSILQLEERLTERADKNIVQLEERLNARIEKNSKRLEERFNDRIEKTVNAAVEDLSEIISTFAQQVDWRFNKMEADFEEIKQSHERLLNTVDGFLSRINGYEIEMAARDRQYDRLLAWARKVSEKTGVPLENF